MPPQRDLQDFKLERFFDKYEFKAPYLLCCSDCEPLTVQELLDVADADSLQRWKDLKLSYGDTRGLPALREAIAGLYSNVSPEQLVVCAPEEGIYLTMTALLRPGDHVVVTYPGYQSLYELAQAKGCELAWWEPLLQPAGGGTEGAGPRHFRFLLDDLKAALRPNTRLVVVNFPHNPTGATLSTGEWQQLVEMVKGTGAYLFSDEMYKFTELPPNKPLPSAADLYNKAISLCGVSKSWGLPGLRIGWVASHSQELLSRVSALKDYTTICNSAPSEVLALMAIRATDKLTARARDIIATNLTLAKAFFARWSDVSNDVE